MKCNLDCSYCESDLYGGHDNSQRHPDYEQCVKAIDFMFAYVDLYMQRRPRAFRHVVLNLYGGESLHHPRIVDIVTQVRQRYQAYADQWSLKITCTTNAIINRRKLGQLIPLIDEFTASYHSEVSERYQALFKENLLEIQRQGRDLKCVVLVHADQTLFDRSQQFIAWLNQHSIRHLPRQLDNAKSITFLNYNQQQVTWFKKLYQDRSHRGQGHEFVPVIDTAGNNNLSDTGRACCGGRQLCADQNYKVREFFVDNNFESWYCSVNQFFVYIKQVTGEVFVNKDCKMNFDGGLGPIGDLEHADKILTELEHNLNNNMPVIQCAKSRCFCGVCAPKARDLDTYHQIMKKYLT